jgi:hypothetical protein
MPTPFTSRPVATRLVGRVARRENPRKSRFFLIHQIEGQLCRKYTSLPFSGVFMLTKPTSALESDSGRASAPEK